MKQMMILAVSALVLAACATDGDSGGSCSRFQQVVSECRQFHANSTGFQHDGKVAGCVKDRGFAKKPDGC